MSVQVPRLKRSISVEGDRVVKIQEPEASRRERLRTQAGREVGRRSGLFIVPAIVSFDDPRGEIVFERLHMIGIRQVLSASGRSMALAGRAAEALAAIHRHMAVADGGTRRETGVDPQKEGVPLHGDFGMRNIFYVPESDDIALIDWSNADWIGSDADFGEPEIDLTVFLMSLFHRRVLGPWPISSRHAVARHFLATYASLSPHGVDIAGLRSLVAATRPAFNLRNRRHKGRLRALGYRHSMIDLGFFLRRLPEKISPQE